jgi:hypothetical protein
LLRLFSDTHLKFYVAHRRNFPAPLVLCRLPVSQSLLLRPLSSPTSSPYPPPPFPHGFYLTFHSFRLAIFPTTMFPKICWLADPFWLRKIATDPHILVEVNIACSVDRDLILQLLSQKLCLIHTNIYQEHTKSTFFYSTLIKLPVACFVGTGSFLIRYFNGHMK